MTEGFGLLFFAGDLFPRAEALTSLSALVISRFALPPCLTAVSLRPALYNTTEPLHRCHHCAGVALHHHLAASALHAASATT